MSETNKQSEEKKDVAEVELVDQETPAAPLNLKVEKIGLKVGARGGRIHDADV